MTWDAKRWPHFKLAELECPCCGAFALTPDSEAALDRFEALRQRLGQPIVFSSYYRCPKHNREVGGAPHSKHLLGIAGDVKLAGHDRRALYDAAQAVGFQAFGFGHGILHIDNRPNPAAWKYANTGHGWDGIMPPGLGTFGGG